MCIMKFGKLLKSLIKEKEMSSQEFLAKLHFSSDEFLGVDETTISRWINSKTTPSFKRQIHILLVMDLSVNDILDLIVIPEKTKSFFSALDKNFIRDKSYIPSIEGHSDISIENSLNEDTKKFILKYYDNFKFYYDLGFENILNHDKTEYLSIFKNNTFIPNSHMCYTILDCDYVNESINLNISSGDIFLHLAYFNGVSALKYLLGTFSISLINLVNKNNFKELNDTNIYSIGRSDSFKDFHARIGSELIYKKDVVNGRVNNTDYFHIHKTPLINLLGDHNIWHLIKLANLYSK